MKQWIALATLAAVSVGAYAQTYPGTKPVAIVVPFAAGGPTDRVARDLAEAMRKQIPGSNFVVENTVGAGGTIGANRVAKAAPDGHTLLSISAWLQHPRFIASCLTSRSKISSTWAWSTMCP